MKISIIIPTYKPSEYFKECLESIKHQTFPKEDFEIIIGLNGCKEPYYSIIKDYLQNNLKEFNTVLLQDDREGASVGRNIGLDKATGEYITFLDDDDYISECYLEELYKVVSPDTVALSNSKAFIDGETKTFVSYCMEEAYYYCTQHGCLSLNSKAYKFFNGPVMKLFHRDIIGERRFDLSFKVSQDCIFNFFISDRIDKVNFTSPNAIYFRRIRSGSATTAKRKKRIKILNSLKSISKYSSIYRKGKYSFYFYITRVGAEIKDIIRTIIK